MIKRCLVLALALTPGLFGDGGTLVFTKQNGAYVISLFSAPEPVRKGVADFSVLIERASDRSPVLAAAPTLRLTQEGSRSIEVHLTHAQATNKLLYAASVILPASGAWHANVVAGSAQAAGDFTVLPEQPPVLAYWPYFALVPLTILLFVLNQWLKRRRARPRARA